MDVAYHDLDKSVDLFSRGARPEAYPQAFFGLLRSVPLRVKPDLG
jgi:hypothetical protein